MPKEQMVRLGSKRCLLSRKVRDSFAARFYPALHVIQHIRDESHDHAIGQRVKNGRSSEITSSWKPLKASGQNTANVVEIYRAVCKVYVTPASRKFQKVPGISQGLAKESSGR
ncbi:hypothetical protein ACLK1T_24795 [Escherichia coli]